MGIFDEVSNTVGTLALTPKGWRLLALISITILCAAAFGVEKLVVVSIQSDRQAFIDRDDANARAVVVVDRKVDAKFEAIAARDEVVLSRIDSLEKREIESHTDIKWIRQILEQQYRPATHGTGP